jgi:hypothetical protein
VDGEADPAPNPASRRRRRSNGAEVDEILGRIPGQRSPVAATDHTATRS